MAMCDVTQILGEIEAGDPLAAQGDNSGQGIVASLRFTGSIAEVRIHELTPALYTPTLETAIDFYAPESRPIIAAAVQAGASAEDLRERLMTEADAERRDPGMRGLRRAFSVSRQAIHFFRLGCAVDIYDGNPFIKKAGPDPGFQLLGVVQGARSSQIRGLPQINIEFVIPGVNMVILGAPSFLGDHKIKVGVA